MGEILGVGLSHYPPLCGPDEDMSGLLRHTMQDESIPARYRDPENWPAEMRAEWAEDEGLVAAAAHRMQLVEGFRRIRSAIDEFSPDALLIIGDDQYENFQETVIPPFAILAYDQDLDLQPWRADARSAMVGSGNAWGEGPETAVRVRIAGELGRELASGLLERDIDVAYAYRPHHHPGLSHAFTNALLFLDYDRQGLDYPVLPFAVNCYGRWVIAREGFVARFDDDSRPDPPSPRPARMMQVGAALAETILASDYRVAIVASSSWSHAFLCDKTYRLRPDTDSDRALYQDMIGNDFGALSTRSLLEIEAAGQQEVLNWFALWGAMELAGHGLVHSEMVETSIFNSNKVFAVYGKD